MTWSRALLRFVAILLVSLVVLIALWPWVAPLYTSAVSTVARSVFRLVEAPNATVLDVRGGELDVYRIVGEGRITPVVTFEPYVFFAIVPLIALFAATPGLGLRRRLARTVGGLAGLYCLHVAYLVSSVELMYAVSGGQTLEALQVAVRILWEASPITIWILLTAGAWRRLLRSVRVDATERERSQSAGPIGAEG